MEQNVDTKSASRPLAAITPFNRVPIISPQNIFFTLFTLGWPNIQLINKPNSSVVADGQFWKYIGLHFFPLRRLLVDNCVEPVNYKKHLWRLHHYLNLSFFGFFWGLNHTPPHHHHLHDYEKDDDIIKSNLLLAEMCSRLLP